MYFRKAGKLRSERDVAVVGAVKMCRASMFREKGLRLAACGLRLAACGLRLAACGRLCRSARRASKSSGVVPSDQEGGRRLTRAPSA
ncbi:hypothetical protein BOC46_33690 [Burkholderia pseudomallei]|nr:hypothetical protein BOC44_31040 [Burkholderia pseudomallei]ARL20176.1 hypothetical protein BOC46_33690 [Burkholderia pseudomallei]